MASTNSGGPLRGARPPLARPGFDPGAGEVGVPDDGPRRPLVPPSGREKQQTAVRKAWDDGPRRQLVPPSGAGGRTDDFLVRDRRLEREANR